MENLPETPTVKSWINGSPANTNIYSPHSSMYGYAWRRHRQYLQCRRPGHLLVRAPLQGDLMFLVRLDSRQRLQVITRLSCEPEVSLTGDMLETSQGEDATSEVASWPLACASDSSHSAHTSVYVRTIFFTRRGRRFPRPARVNIDLDTLVVATTAQNGKTVTTRQQQGMWARECMRMFFKHTRAWI